MLLLSACASPEPSVDATPLFPGGVPIEIEAVPGLASMSAQTCGGCHPEAYARWLESPHAHAWEAPVATGGSFRAAMAAVGDSPACTGCHLPLTVQHEQVTDGYLDGDVTRPRRVPNPAFDASLMTEGVSCAACHVRDGVVLSATEPRPAPHPTRQAPALASSELCATCHQLAWPDGDRPFYDTWGEWDRAGFAQAGVECRLCHMPLRDGRPDHAMAGSPARALTALVSLPTTRPEAGKILPVRARVLNSGAGHAVPTGNPWHAWRLQLRLVDGSGRERATGEPVVLARSIEEAPPWKTTSDSRLLPTMAVELAADFEIPTDLGAGAVELRAELPSGSLTLRRIPIGGP